MTKAKDILNIPLVKNTMKLSASSAFMMFLPLLVTPILSRLYTPLDYGAWGIFSSVISIIIPLLFLSYENAIVKSNKDKDIPNLIILCCIIGAGIIYVSSMVFEVGKHLNINFFIDFPSIPLLLLTLIFDGGYKLNLCVANRAQKYNSLSIINVVFGLTQAIIRILLGVKNVENGLIISNCIALFVAMTTLLIINRKIDYGGKFASLISLSIIKSNAYLYRKFPIYDAPARIIELSISNLVIIVLSRFWKIDALGCYSMISQFIILPISLVGSAMGNVFYKEISEEISDKKAIQSSTIRVAKICFVMSLLPILFLSLGGDHLLVMYLGKQWSNAGEMALCMSIYSLPLILYEPLMPVFRATEQQEIRFKLNVICLIGTIGSLIIASILFKNIYVSLIIYAAIYGIIRLYMFLKILKLCNVNLSMVSKYFYYIIFIVYFILALRIICFLHG